jgi:hypothetical protein
MIGSLELSGRPKQHGKHDARKLSDMNTADSGVCGGGRAPKSQVIGSKLRVHKGSVRTTRKVASRHKAVRR